MLNHNKSEYSVLEPKPKRKTIDWHFLIFISILLVVALGFFIFVQWCVNQSAIIDKERMMAKMEKNFTNFNEPSGLKLMELQLLDVLDNKPEAFEHLENEYQDFVKDQIEYFTDLIEMLKVDGEKLKTRDSWPVMKKLAKANVFAWFSRCHMFEEDMQNICFQQCKDLFSKLK